MVFILYMIYKNLHLFLRNLQILLGILLRKENYTDNTERQLSERRLPYHEKSVLHRKRSKKIWLHPSSDRAFCNPYLHKHPPRRHIRFSHRLAEPACHTGGDNTQRLSRTAYSPPLVD